MSASPGIGLGIALRPGEGQGEWARALDWAEHADGLGLHSVWVPEGHFQRGAMASPLTALAAFAARTRRLRLGTTSLLLPIHHPLRVAADVAALDRLSGGRVLLGLGRGFRSPVFRGFGVEARTKRDRFDAALDAILDAWSGSDAALRPVQRPHPPLVVAAFGPKGLGQAAARGLPYLASPIETLDALAENWRLWREQAPVAEPAMVPVMRSVYVAESQAEATRVREGLEAELARLAPGAPKALTRAAEGRFEDRIVVGRAAQVRDILARYRERLGLTLLVARAEPPATPLEAARASLERLAGEILPGLA